MLIWDRKLIKQSIQGRAFLISAVQDSVKSELEREATVRAETESKLRESEQTLKNLHAKTKQIMNALQQQLEEHNNNKVTCFSFDFIN